MMTSRKCSSRAGLQSKRWSSSTAGRIRALWLLWASSAKQRVALSVPVACWTSSAFAAPRHPPLPSGRPPARPPRRRETHRPGAPRARGRSRTWVPSRSRTVTRRTSCISTWSRCMPLTAMSGTTRTPMTRPPWSRRWVVRNSCSSSTWPSSSTSAISCSGCAPGRHRVWTRRPYVSSAASTTSKRTPSWPLPCPSAPSAGLPCSPSCTRS
mmetsp:Transcript_107066/g.341675  ORF Transcript_107066/g.341675 Transcript_107066/m.341675 type:complete len:211 (-) Transcript_107066:47-679(-)